MNFEQMFVGRNLQVLTQLTNAYIGRPDELLDALCKLPGAPAVTRAAMTKLSTFNALAGLAPIEYLACGLLKHSRVHPTPQMRADWALGAAGTPMRLNRLRILAVVFFADTGSKS